MNVIVTGGSSGIGKAIIGKMLNNRHNITNFDQISSGMDRIKEYECDVSDITSLQDYKREQPIDILINCAGVNYINWIENTPESAWDRIMGINAKGIFNTAKVFMDDLIESEGTILNIVSNASQMPMTNSIAYNASKGAAHIMTLQMARELGPKGITVFGVSPNKVARTGMSKYIDETVPSLRGWTPEFAQEYQLKNLLAGEETDPNTLGEFIAFLLSTKQRHKYLAGCVIPYGA